MKFILALLLASSVVHAGFLDDVFSAVDSFTSGVSEAVFGLPKPDVESVCVQKTIDYYQPSLSSGVITDQLALSAYGMFNSCKQNSDAVEGFAVDCSKKQATLSLCRIVREKCASAKFKSSQLRSAQSFGACEAASNLCFNAVKKNYASCGGKKARV